MEGGDPLRPQLTVATPVLGLESELAQVVLDERVEFILLVGEVDRGRDLVVVLLDQDAGRACGRERRWRLRTNWRAAVAPGRATHLSGTCGSSGAGST